MKTITIKQPYASLICCGLKDIENRTWKTNYRGRVLIHAAVAPVKEGLAALNNKQLFELMNRPNWEAEFENLHNGAIIGSVEIVDCVQNHPSKWAQEGVWNWVLANAELFPEPITGVKGKLSFWEYELPTKAEEVQPKYNPSTTQSTTEEQPKPLPSLEELEKDFRKKVYDSVQAMLENLTFDEQMRVSFLPLIITQCAWVYAFKAMELAARDKVEILKKMSRTMKLVREKYDEELRKDLDFTNRKRIETQADEFLNCVAYDTTMLFYSVRQEILRCAPEYPCVDQRAYAIISLLFINLLEEHNRRMDDFIAEKMNNENLGKNVTNQYTLHLRTGMTAFAGLEGKFNFDNANIKLAMKVIAKRLYEVEFEEVPNS